MPSDVAALSLSPAALMPSVAAAPASGTATAPVAATQAAALHASPVSLLDPSTGLVVLSFYDAKGEETASLPTKRQLDLYRRNETSPNVFQPAIQTASVPPKVDSTPTGLPAEA